MFAHRIIMTSNGSNDLHSTSTQPNMEKLASQEWKTKEIMPDGAWMAR